MNVRTVPGRAYGGELQEPVSDYRAKRVRGGPRGPRDNATRQAMLAEAAERREQIRQLMKVMPHRQIPPLVGISRSAVQRHIRIIKATSSEGAA